MIDCPLIKEKALFSSEKSSLNTKMEILSLSNYLFKFIYFFKFIYIFICIRKLEYVAFFRESN